MDEWNSLHPTPEYYTYPCRLDPHPFMGLDKFIAGRLHQMRAHKSYLAAHPSWWSEDPDTSCPRCRTEEEMFEHAILHCPARLRPRVQYLEPALSLHADGPLWDNIEHLHALSQYLSATTTGFPPEMAPHPCPPEPLREPPRCPPLPPLFEVVLILFLMILTKYLVVIWFFLAAGALVVGLCIFPIFLLICKAEAIVLPTIQT